MSGAVYMADESHFHLLSSIYSTFAHSNPLHADAFPAVARMEAEVGWCRLTASIPVLIDSAYGSSAWKHNMNNCFQLLLSISTCVAALRWSA